MSINLEERKTLTDTKEDTILQEAESIIYNTERKRNYKRNILIIIPLILLCLLLLLFSTVFAILHKNSETIAHGVFINNLEMSNLTKDEATKTLKDWINQKRTSSIILKYNDYQTSLTLEQFDCDFEIEPSLSNAYQLGRGENIFRQNFEILNTFFSPTNFEMNMTYNVEKLNALLDDIEKNLPNYIVEPTAKVEDQKLIITKGKDGIILDKNATVNLIHESILKNEQTIELQIIEKQATSLDLEFLHEQIYKAPVNASYTKNPYTIQSHENGLDFAISMEEANSILSQDKEVYEIPLKTLYPSITTSQISIEAFPDLLSNFSTKYSTRNSNRSHNLSLAAQTINGIVLMPGETFSFNGVLGSRTAAKGYKTATAYVGGELVDSIGGRYLSDF